MSLYVYLCEKKKIKDVVFAVGDPEGRGELLLDLHTLQGERVRL